MLLVAGWVDAAGGALVITSECLRASEEATLLACFAEDGTGKEVVENLAEPVGLHWSG